MQNIKISELKSHPKNEFFFDNMEESKWNEFIESVKTSGVIEPIVITQDKVIVSGHQRVRACKEIGIDEIIAEVRIYDNDDVVIKDLIETNIRQRGEIGGSSIKVKNRILELERIYGIKQGNNQHKEDTNNVGKLSQKNISAELEMNPETYRNYKSLDKLTPEIQELVDNGITFSTASRVISKLSKDEQIKLFKEYGSELSKGVTQTEVQKYIDEIKTQKSEYETKLKKLEILNQEAKTEKIPDDYEYIKGRIKELITENREITGKYVTAQREIETVKFHAEADLKNKGKPPDITHSYEGFEKAIIEFKIKINPFLYMGLIFKEMDRAEMEKYISLLDLIDKDLKKICSLIINAIKNEII